MPNSGSNIKYLPQPKQNPLSSPAAKAAIGVVATLISGVALELFRETVADLKAHGEALAGISSTLVALKEGQARIETNVTARIGEIVNVQQQMQDEVSALRQAEADDRRAGAPRATGSAPR